MVDSSDTPDQGSDAPGDLLPADVSSNPEVPEADAIEQAEEVTPSRWMGRVSRDLEVPEADAIEQAMEVPSPDPYDR